jgi:putative transposase
MSQACSLSTHRVYGLVRVCDTWHVSRSTLHARRAREASPPPVPRRRGPVGPCSDEDLLAAIRRDLSSSPFHGEGHRKVWARLRLVHGLRTSKARVLRLMREHGLLAPSRVGRPRGPRTHDGTILTDAPDLMWGTDLTSTILLTGAQAPVFVAVDHCTGECVGIHTSLQANRFEALEPLRQGVRECFGAFEENIAEGLSIRHDHGSQYLSDDFQRELAFLGMASSPSFVRAPEGNGVAERFIRTLKENLLWVRAFETIEELRQALLDFKRTYNETWRLERLGYRTPAQARRDHAARHEQAA